MIKKMSYCVIGFVLLVTLGMVNVAFAAETAKQKALELTREMEKDHATTAAWDKGCAAVIDLYEEEVIAAYNDAPNDTTKGKQARKKILQDVESLIKEAEALKFSKDGAAEKTLKELQVSLQKLLHPQH